VQHEHLWEVAMLQEESIIIGIYCAISDTLGVDDVRHPLSLLYRSEILLIGVLWALKGGSFKSFHRWLSRRDWVEVPERTRLQKLLKTHGRRCTEFLAPPTFFNVMDTFGIEVIRPIREGRSAQSAAVSAKGKSGHRWIIGRKICVRINEDGEIVSFDDDTANMCDQKFNHLADDAHTITLADSGFRCAAGIPATMKICARGQWNERMTVETLFSLWERICNAKRFFVRSVAAFKTRIAYLVAFTNIAIRINKQQRNPPLSFAHLTL
jgi:Transposase DDE domain